MPLIVTDHAWQRLHERGLTVANANWCVAGANYFVQANGNRHYTRDYDDGDSTMHVLTDGAGANLVTAWIRGRLDPDA